jgi:hypothetical protein
MTDRALRQKYDSAITTLANIIRAWRKQDAGGPTTVNYVNQVAKDVEANLLQPGRGTRGEDDFLTETRAGY